MKQKKVNFRGFYVDLSKVVAIDTAENEFKITLHLDSGIKVEKEIPKIDPYKDLKHRTLKNPKDKRSDEMVVDMNSALRAYLKSDVREVLDREKEVWDEFKKEIIRKWGELL